MQEPEINPHDVVDAVIESEDMKLALSVAPHETRAQVLAALFLLEDVVLLKRFWTQIGPSLSTQERIHAVMMCSEERNGFMLAMTLGLQDRPTGTDILSLMFMWLVEQLLDMPDRQTDAFQDLFEFYSKQAYWLLDVQAMSNAFIGDSVKGAQVQAEASILQWMKNKAAELCADIDSAQWLASNYVPKALSCDELVSSGTDCLEKIKTMPRTHHPSILGQSMAYESAGRFDPGVKQLAEAGFKLRVDETSMSSIAAATELMEHGYTELLDTPLKPEVASAFKTARELLDADNPRRLHFIHACSIALKFDDASVKVGDELSIVPLRRVSYRPYFVLGDAITARVEKLQEASLEHTVEVVLDSGSTLRNSKAFNDVAGSHYNPDVTHGDMVESHMWRSGVLKCLTDDCTSIVYDGKPCLVFRR